MPNSLDVDFFITDYALYHGLVAMKPKNPDEQTVTVVTNGEISDVTRQTIEWLMGWPTVLEPLSVYPELAEEYTEVIQGYRAEVARAMEKAKERMKKRD